MTKCKVVLPMFGIFLAGTALAADEKRTNYFNWETASDQGTTVLNAVDLFQSANWSEGTPTDGDRLSFRQSASVAKPSCLRFVKINKTLTADDNIRALVTDGIPESTMTDLSQPRTVLVSDNPLYFTGNNGIVGRLDRDERAAQPDGLTGDARRSPRAGC